VNDVLNLTKEQRV
jgi:hypothetical protein